MATTHPSAVPPHLPADLPTGLLIGGTWRPASGGARFAVRDPATGEQLVEVADGTPQDGLDALTAAHEAWPVWQAVAPRARAELLRAVFEQVVARVEDFAAVITAEGGKPLAESRAETLYGAEYVRWYSEQAVRINGMTRTAPSGANRQIVLHRGVGPALLVTPWNFPLAMATRKIAPALAAGCPVVVKPAGLTPLTTALFAEVVRAELERRGLPTGVINVVPTSSSSRLVSPLLADPRLRKLSFTGSTEVGRVLLQGAAQNVLRTSMELGGNAPFLVFADADVPAAVEGAVAAKMRNAGQTCVAANRFLVHESVAQEFATGLAARFAAMVVGPGAAPGTTVGPLIDAGAVDRVAEVVAQAVDGGARVVTGGDRPDRSRLAGYFYNPTVLTGVDPSARAVREEIFGPVAPVVTFSTEDEALELANSTEFGLVAYAYTRDVDRVFRVAERIESGMLGVNRGMVSDASAPFGGVKSSGLGREGGEAGIEEYLESVYVAL
ncbi:NAD-dependent succinate-semialdehyde dehydrogenase [Actinotalea sp.]|uniref:NAD-dependent succinate-semialdehyde dehydrogenase n=1 Tax=Actinotalea sp. TaxID=1872145 RepID=UPI002B524ECD|nr:NAD-dependent succinate-semialdehyde dehydrogenase [Actinotalea sp.]HQY33898.1 NAD-dependent succinate-semialdehyde dehydrogenase [Actinotalea sp.]HRA50248.1 NAD-dependent succinate-semialdehyde dehydrogenase [Actinotalea sp.]